MAAVPTNKAGSQISSRQNHNARNSEIANPIRRSFSGNPFAKPSIIANPRGFNSPNTPANSPSDFPRRHSIGRESLSSFRDFEDKENGKDVNPKAARVRSPAATKGSKNFMSPTISAASKINASPRKKILSERNETPVRHSVSFSDVDTIIMEDNKSREMVLTQEKLVELGSHDQTITDMDVKETKKDDEAVSQNDQHESTAETMNSDEAAVVDDEFLVSQNTQQQDSVAETDDADPSFKISPRRTASYSSPMVAPLDADPKMPPYDPKTNYLSPRPQFLNYRPNPRIMLYLNSKREGKRPEDNFEFEGSSDTEVTEEEETQSEESQKQSEDSSESSEPEAMSNTNILLQGIEAKAVLSKPPFFTRSKLLGLVLIMVLACFSLSVTDSPVVQPLLRDLSLYEFYVPPEFTYFAKANFYQLSQKFRLWSANCLSHIYKLVSRLGGVHELGPLQYGNLTGLLEDCSIDGFPHRKFDPILLEPLRERKVRDEIMEDKSHPLVEADEAIDEVDEEMKVGVDEDHRLGFEAEGNSELVCSEHCDSSEDEEVQQETLADFTEHGESSEDEESLERVDSASSVTEPDAGLKQSDSHTNAEQQTFMVVAEVISSEAEKNLNSDAKPESDFEAGEFTAVTDKEKLRLMELSQQPLQLEPSPSEAGKPVIQNDMNDIEAGEFTAVTDKEMLSLMELSQQPFQLEPSPSEAGKPAIQNDMNDLNNNPQNFVLSDVADENSEGSETMDSAAAKGSEDKLSTQNLWPIVFLLLGLIAAIAARKVKASRASDVIPLEQPALSKKFDCSPTQMTTEQVMSWSNWQPEEVETLAESCPSEMSSFQSSFYSQKESGEEESETRRNNRKRESLASSDFSTGSLSYGSFTTYEKIAIKSGQGEAATTTTTPVRRSSRLSKKQVSSS